MAGKEITITGWQTKDVRFPTSLDKTGSDAMNTAGDYSAAYCILQTDSKFSGHGMVRSIPLFQLVLFFSALIGLHSSGSQRASGASTQNQYLVVMETGG
jgi:hypothetical protein